MKQIFPPSGVEHGNLRELALARMKDFGTECRDVRTREVWKLYIDTLQDECSLGKQDFQLSCLGWHPRDPQQDQTL